MAESRDIRIDQVAAEASAGADRSYDPNTTFAVVIGINAYRDPGIRKLRYARSDAERMHAALVDPEVGRIPPENVILLVDENATRENVLNAIGEELPKRLTADGTALIYFAGHGAPAISQRRSSQSASAMEAYLLPVDAKADRLFSTAIPMDQLKRDFDRIGARSIVFFLDACYSGKAGGPTSEWIDSTRGTMTDDFLEELAGEGHFVLTSCAANEVSLEPEKLQEGLFTHFLIRGLRGEADRNQTGVVTVDELYKYVSREVPRAASGFSGKMTPIRKGQSKGDVALTIVDTPQKKRARELRREADAAQARGDLETAETSWREAATLDPNDPSAPKALAAIVARREAERAAREEVERARKQDIARKTNVLKIHYVSRALSAEEFGQAVELLEVDESELRGDDREMRGLVEALAAGTLTVERYKRSVAVLTGELAPPPAAAPVSIRAPEPEVPDAERRPVPTLDRTVANAQRGLPPGSQPPMWKRPSVLAGAAGLLLVMLVVAKLIGGGDARGDAVPDTTAAAVNPNTLAPVARGRALLDAGRLTEAVGVLKPAAATENVDAMLLLASAYHRIDGVAADTAAVLGFASGEVINESWNLLLRAIDLGSTDAIDLIASSMAQSGGELAGDSIYAIVLRRADTNQVKVLTEYLRGNRPGIRANPARADHLRELLDSRRPSGSPAAPLENPLVSDQRRRGEALLVARNTIEAARVLDSAAGRNDNHAMILAATAYAAMAINQQALAVMPYARAQALKWSALAKDSGDARYMRDLGMTLTLTGDRAEVVKWLWRAAAKNDTIAMKRLIALREPASDSLNQILNALRAGAR